MTSTFGRSQHGWMSRRVWGRELPPVLVVAGLAADYLSPSALWTMLLPFAAVVLLASMRKPAHAAAVFLLSSWVLIPIAARTAVAVDDLRGARRLYVLQDMDEHQPSLRAAMNDPDLPRCIGPRSRYETLPIGSGHLFNPQWELRRTVVSFAELHNAIVIERWREDTGQLRAQIVSARFVP